MVGWENGNNQFTNSSTNNNTTQSRQAFMRYSSYTRGEMCSNIHALIVGL